MTPFQLRHYYVPLITKEMLSRAIQTAGAAPLFETKTAFLNDSEFPHRIGTISMVQFAHRIGLGKTY